MGFEGKIIQWTSTVMPAG